MLPRTRVLALAGGVGGAKLALGLSRVLAPDNLTIVVNTGDDELIHGLNISPDLDTMMYTLAGLVNSNTGWGLTGDQFTFMSMLGRYGVPTWFNLGDMDLATHIRRTQLLQQGWTLSEVTQELCTRLGVSHTVVPMSDQTIATTVVTDEGDIPFQVYFVQRRCEPVAKSIRFIGADSARPSPGFQSALESASAVVFCPSNPFLSIDPILAIPGVRDHIKNFDGLRIAISPIVGGQALRGPAGKLLGELGNEVSCVGVAAWYRGICDIFVVDDTDRTHLGKIRDIGMKAKAAATVMDTDADKIALAEYVLTLLGS